MWRYFVRSFKALCFPSSCLHCGESLEGGEPLFCHECALHLVPTDPAQRCKYCYSESHTSNYCREMKSRNHAFCAFASVFDYFGPAATLVKKLKYAKLDYLAKPMGACMAAHLVALDWPLPDILIPVPVSASRLFTRGFNQSESLARGISEIIQRPVCQALGRRSGDYSQAGLIKHQRLDLKAESFVLIQPQDIQGKTILLLDDVTTTGQTLRRCAEVLQAAGPRSTYLLSFCLAGEK